MEFPLRSLHALFCVSKKLKSSPGGHRFLFLGLKLGLGLSQLSFHDRSNVGDARMDFSKLFSPRITRWESGCQTVDPIQFDLKRIEIACEATLQSMELVAHRTVQLFDVSSVSDRKEERDSGYSVISALASGMTWTGLIELLRRFDIVTAAGI
jgi:hypothetical protein